MDEQEILKQFVNDYQSESMEILYKKYSNDEYWDALHYEKPFNYIKKTNQLNILIEKDPNCTKYTALTKHGSQYRVNLFNHQEYFDNLNDAAKFKLKFLVDSIFSSLSRK